MINYNTVQKIYSRNYGSIGLYKRPFFNPLVYTDGVMDFQHTLNAYWIVDNIISYMPEILKTFKESEDTFYVVEISVNKERQGYMEVYREGYIGNDYNEHITVIKQDIPFIDLPVKTDDEITTYKFYLTLSNYGLPQFMLMLPSEYWG